MLIRVQTKPRFTAQELADEFGVSRRTMLRDLQALSSMGMPLRSTPEPDGGYALPRGRRLFSPSFTVDEALGLIVSYKTFLRYSEAPFSTLGLSAVTKLRAALPPAIVGELTHLRRHVVVVEPAHNYEAPLLGELLRAALDGAHLKVVYDSRSGVSERIAYPFGLYASQGFWYCACFDYKRHLNVALRADRFISMERVEGLDRPPHVPLEEWTHLVESGGGERLRLRASVTERGTKSFELTSLLDQIQTDPSGRGILDTEVPRSEIDFYASRLLSVGTDVTVKSPPELIEAMRRKAEEIADLYREDSRFLEATQAGNLAGPNGDT